MARPSQLVSLVIVLDDDFEGMATPHLKVMRYWSFTRMLCRPACCSFKGSKQLPAGIAKSSTRLIVTAGEQSLSRSETPIATC